ncbi:MAG: protein jag [Firmicutes bacterium]|nr:protein jag [Bacillota bacterium]MDD7601162.1 protein jag [Bacillota bacterium]MDY5857126.1 RNA-binding cell elongation regulator Jag/EloR [Anaerovoracaceae bacterium]
MDYSEKWGTDVETAVKLALDDLGLTRDEVDVKVLEEPSRGFFGIGSKLAKVRVEKKKPVKMEEKIQEETVRKETVKPVQTEQVEKTEPQEKLQKPQAVRNSETRTTSQKRNNNSRRDRNNHSGKSKKDRREKESREFHEPLEPVIARVPEEDLTVCENHIALDFLAEVTEQMGLSLNISAKQGNDVLYIEIQGKDSGTIIGKRGQTLDAIQYLTSLVVNKDQEKYTRVVVDAENYRAKREKTLELLAIRLANKVVKTGKSVKLEPMNPYERKVIHATLQNHPYVTTKSEGQDPYRRVIIELK